MVAGKEQYYKVIILRFNNKLDFKYIAVQDDSESDDAGVANPVKRDRHEDDNYSSGEGGSEIITVDSDNEENVGNQLLGKCIRVRRVIVVTFFG